MTSKPDLAALLCSRLCHDLISPVGAVGNGVELLRADPKIPQDELDLIDDSAALARAALAYFRVAFGAAASDSQLGANELGRIVRDHYRLSRVEIGWELDGALPRPLAKTLLLLIMTGASTLPLGGTVTVAAEAHPASLKVTAAGRRVTLSPEAAAIFGEDADAVQITAREAHLALLRDMIGQLGLGMRVDAGEEQLTLEASEV